MRYEVEVVGYVVSLSEGTELVRGSYEVDALYRAEAKRMAHQLARDEVEGNAALVIVDAKVTVMG